MKFTLEVERDDAAELCAFLASTAMPSSLTNIGVDVAGQMQDDIQNEDERRAEQHQEHLMESGGVDDSSYRREMVDAGRGHLIR